METTNQMPDRDEIARRAYQLWEQRGRPDGHDVDFWLEAEREMISSGNPANNGAIQRTSLDLELRERTALMQPAKPAPKRGTAPAKITRKGQIEARA